MTTLDDIQDLAAALHSRRPDWDLVPTLNYLLPHRQVPIEQLWPSAVAWAENEKNRTPASLQYLKIAPPKSSESSLNQGGKAKDRCYICGNTRPECERMHKIEVSKGFPDPHDFESKDQADANRSDRQWPRLVEEMNRLRAARAKERADRARAEIRPMIATGGDKSLLPRHDDQPRKCTGCGGTLASSYTEPTHPGCAPQPEQQEIPA